MLTRIQKYLLLNHPLLWNMRIVPVLGFTILVNAIVFLIGYSSSSIDFSASYNINDVINSGVLYFSIGLVSLLTLIIWLIFYSKNNAFRSFYPQKSKALYLEWVLIYVICFMTILPFFSLNIGSTIKERSYATKKEAIKAIETLNMVKILIPSDKTTYYEEYPDNRQIAAITPKNETTSLDSAIILAENQSIYYEDYPNFLQLSLLNYSGYTPVYISEDYGLNLRDSETVKDWLLKEDKDSINRLMDDFLGMHKRHNLKTNLTKDTWMKLVYNPSKYPVGDFNLINNCNIGDNQYLSYSYKSDRTSRNSEYYLQFEELRRGYEKVFDAHMKYLFDPVPLLFVLCIAGGISLLIFSYRATSGKAWLIAFVSLGIFLFVDGIFSLMLGASMYLIILLILFGIELYNILSRNRHSHNKGRSNIYMNHLFWFIPAVPVILFSLLYTNLMGSCYSLDSTLKDSLSCKCYNFMNEHIMEFIFGNICLTFVSIWFFIRYVLLKWKSLPEE